MVRRMLKLFFLGILVGLFTMWMEGALGLRVILAVAFGLGAMLIISIEWYDQKWSVGYGIGTMLGYMPGYIITSASWYHFAITVAPWW